MPSSPLLRTKLFAPPVRPDAVRRPRLVTAIEQGIRNGHALLAAPAGFGKSTLTAQWIDATRIPVAWLSLDEDERDPHRFLSYLTAALRTIEPDALEAVERSLRAAQPEPPTVLATALVNALAAGSEDVALVLDDYHQAAAAATDEIVTFLIDRAPPRLHLILTTRNEPALPLARLRARGRLVDLRGEDLRFAEDEATTFLTESMGLDLSEANLDALRLTTEGWAAGLQLAGLSLRGREDVDDRVHDFTGHHRHVLDYLSAEVLNGVDEDVRAFLLDVAILDRLCAPLCDAVTGRDDAAEMLERLERANLFLVPLDDERRWYRFHHLFVDVLRARARTGVARSGVARTGVARPGAAAASDDGSDRQADLHRRASRWFEAIGSAGEAITHALAAADVDRAARLLELAWPEMDRNFQVPTWQRWAARLPDEVLRARPVLAVAVAWVRLGEGDLQGSEAWLADAEAWIEARRHEDDEEAQRVHAVSVADDAFYRALPARIAAARAYAAQATGDVAAGESYARQAVDLAPDDDPGARALPAGLLGLSAWARGDLHAALAGFTIGLRGFRDLGDASAALSFTFAIADVQRGLGRLRDAAGTLEDGLRYAAQQPGPTLPGESETHVGMAEVKLERGETAEAEVELRTGEALSPAGVLTGDHARWTAARAWVWFGLGHAETALALLDEADALELPAPMPTVRATDATRARIWLAQGRLAEAQAWADERGPVADLAMSYVDEFAHLTHARVLLATFRSDGTRRAIDEARSLLARVAAQAEATDRTGTVVEARVLEALASRAAGDDAAALASILAALRLTVAEGHHAVFVNEGPAMAALLRAAGREGADRRQTRRLLAALGDAADRPGVLPDLVEPLSQREGDVLRLLQSDLRGPQIARELGMSVHTFRSHTKNLYAKLGVHGRREAVRRAQDLELI